MTYRQRKYNLSEEEFEILLEFQDNRCTPCGRPFTSDRPPCVDHRHLDGLVRGLLCSDCNDAAGRRHDNAQWFKRMGDYLQYPPSADAGVVVYVPGSPGAEGVSV